MLEEFGVRLKSMREQKGLSQERLAELVGVSLSSLRAYEKIVNDSSRNKPPIDTIIRIADTLDVSLDYLCRGKDEKLREGNAIPILRSLVGVIELFCPSISLNSHEINEEIGSIFTGANLYFSSYDFENDPYDEDVLSCFLLRYEKVRDCGLKDIDSDLYEKTIEALLQQWAGYSVYNGTLACNEYWERRKKLNADLFDPIKEGDPDGNDTEKE